MLIDHEAVLLSLKQYIGSKSHHGQRDLLAEIARLEVKHQLTEGLPERALRLYGARFSEDLLRPSPEGGRVLPPDGGKVRALRGDSHSESEEDTHDHQHRAGRAAG